MTDEQRKRVHAITYSCDDRAELAERIVALEDERDHWRAEQVHAYSNWEDAHKRASELEDENKKLRSELESVGTAAYLYGRGDLQAENAKLRELVADMWRFTGTACKKYPRLFDHAAQGGQMVQLNMIDVFEQRMRDLGIEADA